MLATEQQLVQLEPGTNKPLIRPGMVLLAHPLTSTNDWQNCVAVLYPTNHQANSADARTSPSCNANPHQQLQLILKS